MMSEISSFKTFLDTTLQDCVNGLMKKSLLNMDYK